MIPAEEDRESWGPSGLPLPSSEAKDSPWEIDAQETKDYLRIQKDIYLATPKGFPVEGNVSSPFGKREDPFSGEEGFHSGVDISASPGTPIRATADGIVIHSGWTQYSGFLVVLEHGHGFKTIYAHNKKNLVKVRQTIKRGEVIA